jgi:hypothetical protein
MVTLTRPRMKAEDCLNRGTIDQGGLDTGVRKDGIRKSKNTAALGWEAI